MDLLVTLSISPGLTKVTCKMVPIMPPHDNTWPSLPTILILEYITKNPFMVRQNLAKWLYFHWASINNPTNTGIFLI